VSSLQDIQLVAEREILHVQGRPTLEKVSKKRKKTRLHSPGSLTGFSAVLNVVCSFAGITGRDTRLIKHMVVIRCTQKLLRRLPPSESTDAISTTRLGDWCGSLFNVGRIRVVLFISERSRLPVVLPARDLGNVATHLATGLKRVLETLGVCATVIRQELEAMTDVQFAPTNNRSLLGSINDFRNQLEWWMEEYPRDDWLGLSLKLAETPVGPLNYQQPVVVTIGLLKSG
jgi:hypothetical protein